MKIKKIIYISIILFTSCATPDFSYSRNYKYPEWVNHNFRYCGDDDISKDNKNDVVIFISSMSLNPFGWSRWSKDSITLMINNQINVKSFFIKELVLEDNVERIVLVKNKNVKRLQYRFKPVKSYVTGRVTYNKPYTKIMNLKLVYSVNNGEYIMQTDKVKVWK